MPLVVGFTPRRPWFEYRSGHIGFVVDKMALGYIFPSTSAPLPIVTPLIAQHSSSVIQGCYNVPNSVIASGLSLTPPQETKERECTNL
jgi:hypothetical protein